MNLNSCISLILVLGAVLPNTALAYLLKQPKLSIVASPDGSALLRIEPGTWLPKAGDPVEPARATVFSYDAAAKVYRAMTAFPLRNPVAPTTAIISDRAEFIVTCDDWDPNIGCTSNVVVVYRGTGEFVKAWALEDIFSAKEIERLGPAFANVPLRRWRGEKVSFIQDSKGPAVWISWDRESTWHLGLRLDLKSLNFEKHPERDSDK